MTELFDCIIPNQRVAPGILVGHAGLTALFPPHTIESSPDLMSDSIGLQPPAGHAFVLRRLQRDFCTWAAPAPLSSTGCMPATTVGR